MMMISSEQEADGDDVATLWFTDQFVSNQVDGDLHMKTFNSLIKSACALDGKT